MFENRRKEVHIGLVTSPTGIAWEKEKGKLDATYRPQAVAPTPQTRSKLSICEIRIEESENSFWSVAFGSVLVIRVRRWQEGVASSLVFVLCLFWVVHILNCFSRKYAILLELPEAVPQDTQVEFVLIQFKEFLHSMVIPPKSWMIKPNYRPVRGRRWAHCTDRQRRPINFNLKTE